MSEGMTCYERDENLCEDQMCLRVGCKLRNKRQASEWQPIETAPKDGTFILLGWVNSGVSEGRWLDGASSYWNLPGFYFTDDDPLTARPCTPTHWRPLPAPPVQP